MPDVALSTDVITARTWLFVPGDRPERYAKALASGADMVIIDLEDAVAPSEKDRARYEASTAISRGGSFAVRVGATPGEDGERDVEALRAAGARPRAIVVAKAEDPAALDHVGRTLGAPVIALIESARGLEAASEIAAASSVARLALGAVDLSLDLDSVPDEDVLAPVRSRLVVASRAARLAGPLDSPSLDIAALERVGAAASTARRVGMGGMLCIHPAQVPVVATAFLPSEAEVSRARAILDAAAHDGAAQIDGQMIDLPVLERARRVLADAGRSSASAGSGVRA
ncbi:HpcH/HpaI aldolase/citrate lyase family protein [Microbacterium aurantiacum]|nr:CoA ester lyase [Microbacterium aurantiacum]